MIIDIDHLHHVVTWLDGGLHPRGIGVTTAVLYLMLGEAQLADADTHFVYVAMNEVDARHAQNLFVRMLCGEPGLELNRNQYQQIQLKHSGMVFFFVGLEYFTQRFAFTGTRINRIFTDLPGDLSTDQQESLNTKLHILQAHGADIINGE